MNVFIDLFYKILLFQIRSRLTIFPMYQFCLASRMMRNPFLGHLLLREKKKILFSLEYNF